MTHLRAIILRLIILSRLIRARGIARLILKVIRKAKQKNLKRKKSQSKNLKKPKIYQSSKTHNNKEKKSNN